jgi:hypothetical protein
VRRRNRKGGDYGLHIGNPGRDFGVAIIRGESDPNPASDPAPPMERLRGVPLTDPPLNDRLMDKLDVERERSLRALPRLDETDEER